MRKGVLLAAGAYLMWGLFPVYWPLLEPAGALEILAHRMFWSAVLMALTVTAMRHWRQVRELSARTWALVCLAAVLVAINWGVYIYAVNNGHVLDAALGYFIIPLVSVGLGVAVLRERLSATQWTALGIAVVGVVLTAMGTRGFPYLGVALAVTFGLYGLIKRVIQIPAAISLLGESAVLAAPALGFLIWLQVDGSAHFTGYGGTQVALLIGAGAVTAVPLLLFGAAARLLPLSVIGFIQYINPLTQFLLGVLWAREVMSPGRWAGFVVIWIALIVLSIDIARRARRQAARSRTVAASGEVVRGGEPAHGGSTTVVGNAASGGEAAIDGEAAGLPAEGGDNGVVRTAR